MNAPYYIKTRFWIASPHGTYLGEGRIRLLQEIEKTGSISAAAKSLELSYRKAWKMIDVMNEQSSKPVVERVSGGKSGGGTRITNHGKQAILKYLALKEKCNAYIEATFKTFEFE